MTKGEPGATYSSFVINRAAIASQQLPPLAAASTICRDARYSFDS
jgi:hypothetical protein